ncbi:MAG: OmpP1/FadL family transporter [Desulfovibrio sp.]|nr:outer membrane protein transport protein [Mailhella sp.]
MNVSRRTGRALRRVACALLAAAGLSALPLSHACAEGFFVTEWSARGVSLGAGITGGMVARADDASAMAYNPAGITQIPGTMFQAGISLAMLNFDLSRHDTGKHVSSADQVFPIPHIYMTHQLNDRVWLGLATFTRYGLGSKFPNNWGAPEPGKTPGTFPLYPGGPSLPASGVLRSVKLLSSTVNPNIAIKLNDTWSVSAGVSYTWGYLNINQQYNVLSPYGMGHADARIHSENGYAFGWNVGVHARFNDQWSAGFAYRAKEDMTFSGKTRFRHSGSPAVSGVMQQFLKTCDSRGKLNVPDTFVLGVMYKPLPNLSFEADLGYTVWSRYRNLSISMQNGTPQFFEQKNWKDGWTFTLGVEYRPVDWLALRAGYTYETTPLQDSNCYDYLVPSNGRNYYTAGVGFTYGNWTLDLAYMYINVRDITYPAFGGVGKVENGIIKEYSGRAHNSYCHSAAMTIGYRF